MHLTVCTGELSSLFSASLTWFSTCALVGKSKICLNDLSLGCINMESEFPDGFNICYGTKHINFHIATASLIKRWVVPSVSAAQDEARAKRHCREVYGAGE